MGAPCETYKSSLLTSSRLGCSGADYGRDQSLNIGHTHILAIEVSAHSLFGTKVFNIVEPVLQKQMFNLVLSEEAQKWLSEPGCRAANFGQE